MKKIFAAMLALLLCVGAWGTSFALPEETVWIAQAQMYLTLPWGVWQSNKSTWELANQGAIVEFFCEEGAVIKVMELVFGEERSLNDYIGVMMSAANMENTALVQLNPYNNTRLLLAESNQGTGRMYYAIVGTDQYAVVIAMGSDEWASGFPTEGDVWRFYELVYSATFADGQIETYEDWGTETFDNWEPETYYDDWGTETYEEWG